MAWSINADLYVAASNAENRDFDLISDYQTLIFFSRKN
jgi:hypothetical protein